jgi:DNA-directed RNA polymerase specialized sigma24 family protein/predicted nucleotidyltransferase
MSDDSVPLTLPLPRFAADSCETTALYRDLRKPLLRYLVCLGLSNDEAQDVVQDAFLSLQRHLAAGGSQENIRSWLFRVAHNHARTRQNNRLLMLSTITTFVVDLYHMLELRSKARQQLLAYYFTNPTARHHLRDLAERLRIDPSNLSKELRRLERDGLFRSEVSGRQKYFQLNREYPLFDEVRKIVAKTIGAGPVIAQSLKRVEGIDEAYLYGSFASNQQDAASDIDVLVIGSPREEVLAQAVRRLERQLGREINYTVLTPKEFESRRARKDAFLENVWHNKRVSLVGRDEEAKTARR